jgi:hypothetical protein
MAGKGFGSLVQRAEGGYRSFILPTQPQISGVADVIGSFIAPNITHIGGAGAMTSRNS